MDWIDDLGSFYSTTDYMPVQLQSAGSSMATFLSHRFSHKTQTINFAP
jgi:hypothetical protein